MQSIFNAANDDLIYQRKGRGNLAKIQQQPVNQKNIWQMQKINYASAFTTAAVADSCAFGDAFDMGGDSGWMSSWGSSGGSIFANIEVSGDGGNCYDPFGAGGGGGGETCERCRTRNRNACNSDRTACGATAYTAGAAIVIGCAVTVVGVIACAGVAVILGAAGGLACSSAYDSCMSRVDNNCPSCTQ